MKFFKNFSPLKKLLSDPKELLGSYETTDVIWSYRICCDLKSFLLPLSSFGYVCLIKVTVNSGKIGIFLEDMMAKRVITPEKKLEVGEHNLNLYFENSNQARLVIRNVSDKGTSSFELQEFQILSAHKLDVTDHLRILLPEIIKSENSKDLDLLAKNFNLQPAQIRKLVCNPNLSLEVDMKEIFSDSLGKMLLNEFEKMVEIASLSNTEKLNNHQMGASLNREYWKRYLRQSVIRIYHLIKQFQEFGFNKGSIVEIGCFIGTFAIPLQRLGYEVTVVDRFDYFEDTIDVYKKEMQKAGIKIVETNENNEYEIIKNLPKFDAVITMAVIEHIPHTPKYFLESLKAKVKDGGLMAVDTPNLARYWSRKALNDGKSVHQSIENQFNSKIPFLGHHREFTSEEVKWMLLQIGLKEVVIKMFDYNLFQFDKIEGEHLEALLEMICNYELKDTILAVGKVKE